MLSLKGKERDLNHFTKVRFCYTELTKGNKKNGLSRYTHGALMETHEVTKLRTLGKILDVLADHILQTRYEGDAALSIVTENAAALELHTDMVFREIDHVQNVKTQIDHDGNLIRSLEDTRNKFAGIHETLLAKYNAMSSDGKDQGGADLLGAYGTLTKATADLHNVINDLCWHIGEHDADFDKPMPGSFGNAEDLFASMGI